MDALITENYNYTLSIITINLNNEHGLIKTINSVINQTEKAKIEYIIIDGDSIDKSKSIINDNIKHINNFISEKDEGVYDAMNKGINLSKGKYCLFLNSGDYFVDKSVLNKILPSLLSFNGIVYCNGYFKKDNKLHPTKLPTTISKDYFFNASLMHPSTFISKEILINSDLFNTNYKISGDYDFFIKCYTNGISFKHLDISVSVFTDGGISTDKKWSYLLKIENRQIRMTYFSKEEILTQIDARDRLIEDFKTIKPSYFLFKAIKYIQKIRL